MEGWIRQTAQSRRRHSNPAPCLMTLICRLWTETWVANHHQRGLAEETVKRLTMVPQEAASMTLSPTPLH